MNRHGRSGSESFKGVCAGDVDSWVAGHAAFRVAFQCAACRYRDEEYNSQAQKPSLNGSDDFQFRNNAPIYGIDFSPLLRGQMS